MCCLALNEVFHDWWNPFQCIMPWGRLHDPKSSIHISSTMDQIKYAIWSRTPRPNQVQQKSTLPLPNHLGLKLKNWPSLHILRSASLQRLLTHRTVQWPLIVISGHVSRIRRVVSCGWMQRRESVKMLSSTILPWSYQQQGQLIFKPNWKIK